MAKSKKTAYINFRVDEDLKKEADDIMNGKVKSNGYHDVNAFIEDLLK